VKLVRAIEEVSGKVVDQQQRYSLPCCCHLFQRAKRRSGRGLAVTVKSLANRRERADSTAASERRS